MNHKGECPDWCNLDLPHIHDEATAFHLSINPDYPCPTPGCPGDGRYAAPGRLHLPECTFPMSVEMYDIALKATDDVLGKGTYADLNEGNSHPGVQAAIARAKNEENHG